MSILSIAKFSFFVLALIVLCGEESSAQRHICGNALVQALENICVNGYNAKRVNKKSMDFKLDSSALDDYANYNDIDDEELVPSPYSNLRFLAKIHGGSADFLAKTRRRRYGNGIYDECCTKACTISELKSYCL